MQAVTLSFRLVRHSPDASGFGLRLVENPSFLKRDAGQASMTERSRKDSRQAGVTALEDIYYAGIK